MEQEGRSFWDIGAEEGVLRWCALNQMRARPLRLIGYEDEAE